MSPDIRKLQIPLTMNIVWFEKGMPWWELLLQFATLCSNITYLNLIILQIRGTIGSKWCPSEQRRCPQFSGKTTAIYVFYAHKGPAVLQLLLKCQEFTIHEQITNQIVRLYIYIYREREIQGTKFQVMWKITSVEQQVHMEAGNFSIFLLLHLRSSPGTWTSHVRPLVTNATHMRLNPKKSIILAKT